MTQPEEPKSSGEPEVERVKSDEFRETLAAPMPNQSYRQEVDLIDNQPSALGQLFRYIATVLILLLAVRFVANLLTLGRSDVWVSFFYLTTNWLVQPFQGLFGQPQVASVNGFVDWASLAAMAVIVVAAWILSLIFRPRS